MRQCNTFSVDISYRRSNARYCSDACKNARPAKSAIICEICGANLSHRPKAKYCAGECARSVTKRQRQEWRANPENHERERRSRNSKQNAKYANDLEFRDHRKADSKDYYWSHTESVLAKDRERRSINSQDPEWIEKDRARRRTPQYHATRNATERKRRANDPAYAERERARGRHRYSINPGKWVKARAVHKQRYNSDTNYRNRNRNYHRKWKFGLPPGKFDEMLLEQNGRCAICGRESLGSNLNVDHEHSTGQARGLLCGSCNRAIGKFNEKQELLLNAVHYLHGRRWKPHEIPSISEERLAALLDVSEREFWASKNNSLKTSYGIDKYQYGWLFERGNGLCWLCQQPEKAKLGRRGIRKLKGNRVSSLNVDHDHGSVMIRGLLCYNCNTGIGQLYEDLELFRRAAAYLSQWNGVTVQAKLLAF